MWAGSACMWSLPRAFHPTTYCWLLLSWGQVPSSMLPTPLYWSKAPPLSTLYFESIRSEAEGWLTTADQGEYLITVTVWPGLACGRNRATTSSTALTVASGDHGVRDRDGFIGLSGRK